MGVGMQDIEYSCSIVWRLEGAWLVRVFVGIFILQRARRPMLIGHILSFRGSSINEEDCVVPTIVMPIQVHRGLFSLLRYSTHTNLIFQKINRECTVDTH